MLNRKDRVITTQKVNTAPGKVGFLRGGGGQSGEVIYFSSADGNWRMLGRVPVVSLRRDGAPGATVLLLSTSPPPSSIHFPSPTFLIFTRTLPWSLWEKAERKKRSEAAHSLCHLCFPHSQTRFIPHSCGLQSSLGSSQICLPVCGKRGILSQPCSLTVFPHSRVIKKAAPNPQPSLPLLFSRHCSTSISSGTGGSNVLADTFTLLGPDWITGKEEKLSCISWARLPLHGLVQACLRYHGSP